MTKKVVNEDQYIAILNQELRMLPEYKNGMEIVSYPEGASGANLSGISVKGPVPLIPGLLSRIEKTLEGKYEVRVTRRD